MTSNSYIAILVTGALLCAPVAGLAESREIPEDDLLEYYQQNIHQKPSGTYCAEGWVFFHQRISIGGTDTMFGQVKGMRKALPLINKAIFAKLDEMESGVQTPEDPSLVGVRGLAKQFGSKNDIVQRDIGSLKAKTLSQDVDGEDFVYDLAIKESVLEKEASKGRFSERPDTVTQYWQNIVKDRLRGKDQMAFIKGCGAIDLWTLKSAKLCGVKELQATNNTEEICCMRCIADLRKSAALAMIPASEEYARLLDGLYANLTNEAAATGGSVTNRTIRMMLMSFGCCNLNPQKERLEDLDMVSEYIDQKMTPKETIEAFASVLIKTPGSNMYWSALGRALAREDKWHMALSCYRNALRLKLDDGYALDGLACAYRHLGCRDLSRGAALLSFALTDDGAIIKNAREILADK